MEKIASTRMANESYDELTRLEITTTFTKPLSAASLRIAALARLEKIANLRMANESYDESTATACIQSETRVIEMFFLA
jgi:hypothetical protein